MDAKTKYEILQEAYSSSKQWFQNYEEDCRNAIDEYRNHLASYLDCSTENIVGLPFSEESIQSLAVKANYGFIGETRDKKMILFETGWYRFALSINLGGQHIYIQQAVKRVSSDCYIFTYGHPEFQIFLPGGQGFEQLSEAVFKDLEKYLKLHFDRFEESPKRNIGFELY